MYFNEQMFNPNTVNPINYYHIKMQINQITGDQDKEVVKAVKAIHDLCEAVKKMDGAHQQTAFLLCLQQMAVEFNW